MNPVIGVILFSSGQSESVNSAVEKSTFFKAVWLAAENVFSEFRQAVCVIWWPKKNGRTTTADPKSEHAAMTLDLRDAAKIRPTIRTQAANGIPSKMNGEKPII